jgi:hypothetical protein
LPLFQVVYVGPRGYETLVGVDGVNQVCDAVILPEFVKRSRGIIYRILQFGHGLRRIYPNGRDLIKVLEATLADLAR